ESGRHRAAPLTLWLQKVLPRQSRSFAACPRQKWNRSETTRRLWQKKVYAFWQWLELNFVATYRQRIPMDTNFVFSVWLG
ncbi:MAG: hypothetical protein WA637_16595, partial [Terriglobales bacterium]